MRKKIYLISGFTLIELMVAMSIVAFLATASVAILGNFNRRQALNIAQDDVKNALAQAKSYALSQVVTGCKVNDPIATREELYGYRVTFDASKNPDEYYVGEVCLDSARNPKYISPVNTYYLPSEVSFGTVPAAGITFKVLTGGADNPASINLGTSDGRNRPITVDTKGVIN